jgi:hypothetical protein
MEQRGTQTERGDFNREVQENNKTMLFLSRGIDELERQFDMAIRIKNRELTQRIRHLKADCTDLNGYQRAITDNEKMFQELVTEQGKGKGDRSSIQRKLLMVRYSKEQAEHGLMRKYGIEKVEIPAKLKELTDDIISTSQQQEKFALLLCNVEAFPETDDKDIPSQTMDHELQIPMRSR